MSFGKTSELFTWILIALIPISAGAGMFIGWAIYSGGGTSITLTVKGSTTVEPIILVTVEPFEATHQGVTIEGSFAGSGTGISALIDGNADVAVSSRTVKSSENDSAFSTHNEYLRAYAIAKDGLAVITNNLSTSTNFDLTIDEIKAIFNGTITSWDDPLLTGNGLTGNILVIARDSASGTRGSFDELVMGDDDYVSGFQEKTSNADVVTEVGTNPQAIGYCGIAYLDSTVKTVFIDGIEPTKETILDGSYDISRELFVVTLGYPGVNTMIWEYVQWLFSPTAQYYVDYVGFIAIQMKRDDLA
ncbi:MAG: phosphate ABC transporter substrate-binding protein [Asgard group archaeon]|nr:phosphate ABC transporter substrate-binding protein [Asgard group archaeon]